MILPRFDPSTHEVHILERNLQFFEILKFFPRTFGWKLLNENDGIYTLSHKQHILKVKQGYAWQMITEWKFWQKCYLPNFSLQGKTVLDVGASCGETAHLFFLCHAKKVIAVEPNLEAVKLLYENIEKNNWNLQVFPLKFHLGFLDLDFDWLKMDCEGCEKLLLQLTFEEFPRCVVEVHDEATQVLFQKKYGLKVEKKISKNVSIMKKT